MFHSRKGCGDDEVEWCFLYEYWREWVNEHGMRNDVVKWRRQFEREFHAWQNAIQSWDTDDTRTERDSRKYRFAMLDKAGAPNGLPFEIFYDFPEFPKTPWLKIPIPTRRERLKTIQARLSKTIEGSVGELRDPSGRYVSKATRKDYFDGEVTWCVFSICWEWGVDSIKKAFDIWLAKNKPKRPKPPVEHRAALKQLGALRLMKAMDTSTAGNYTRDFLKDKNGATYPLFSDDESGWRRARNAAQKRLKYLSW